jgi:hypothetical protein
MIFVLAIGGTREHQVGTRGEALGSRHGQVFLAGEVVEEAALGEAGGGAHVFHLHGRVALGADQVDGGVKQALPGGDGGGGRRSGHGRLLCIPVGMDCKYQPVWR